MKRGILILATILLATDCLAISDRLAYVDTDCAENGDGTTADCAGSPGGVGAFSNLCNAYAGELALGSNLRDTGGGRDIMLYFMVEGTTPDTCTNDGTGVQFSSGFLKSNTHHVILKGNDSATGRHPGYWSEQHYRIVNSSSSGVLELKDFDHVFNIQIEAVSIAAGSNIFGIDGTGNIFSGTIENNLVKCSGVGNSVKGIQLTNGGIGGSENRVANNVVFGCDVGIRIPLGSTPTGTAGLYNNTIKDSLTYGIEVSSCATPPFCGVESAFLKLCNNLIQDSGTEDIHYGTDCEDYPECFPACGGNMTSDATSPDGAALQNQTASFRDPANNNYQLQYNDTACLRRGEDLSADEFYPVATDNQNQTRATSGNDCGGDYVPPEELATHRLRSGLKDRIKKLHQ